MHMYTAEFVDTKRSFGSTSSGYIMECVLLNYGSGDPNKCPTFRIISSYVLQFSSHRKDTTCDWKITLTKMHI